MTRAIAGVATIRRGFSALLRSVIMLKRLKRTAALAGLSAGVMYFFDPDLGERRRAAVRDQIHHLLNKFGLASAGAPRPPVAAGSNVPQGRIHRATIGTSVGERRAMTEDELVDEASVESFPASDAPSY